MVLISVATCAKTCIQAYRHTHTQTHTHTHAQTQKKIRKKKKRKHGIEPNVIKWMATVCFCYGHEYWGVRILPWTSTL